jgi:hypothetical protein
VADAIANVAFDAVGVRITHLAVSVDKVLAGLTVKGGKVMWAIVFLIYHHNILE